ncbi:MAG TPA: VTT domain-containing protein [Thermodesulfobacteriota bacterium]|nr:VTT domain-containing protein [Thermodesulfobacteriota bacterium]
MIRLRIEGIPKSVRLAVAVTVVMVLVSSGVSVLFGERLLDLGEDILTSYGRTNTDIMLYLVTSISASPLTLPVSAYAVAGTLLGYEPGRLITIIALGAVTGSSVSYLLGRCFGDSPFVRRRFPEMENHSWTKGRSLKIVSLILLGGAMSPIPVHPMYAACGMMRYPAALFLLLVFLGWWVRIGFVVMGIKLISDMTL